jgi:hypothetical protein
MYCCHVDEVFLHTGFPAGGARGTKPLSNVSMMIIGAAQGLEPAREGLRVSEIAVIGEEAQFTGLVGFLEFVDVDLHPKMTHQLH